MSQAVSATLHALSPNQHILAILVFSCSCPSMLGTAHKTCLYDGIDPIPKVPFSYSDNLFLVNYCTMVQGHYPTWTETESLAPGCLEPPTPIFSSTWSLISKAPFIASSTYVP